MEIEIILRDSVEKGEALLYSAATILQCESYCAQLQLYRNYLRQNIEKAELYYNNFREFNNKIFTHSLDILEIAINEGNVELADCAMETIRIMKETYPKFYSSYCKQIFGK